LDILPIDCVSHLFTPGIYVYQVKYQKDYMENIFHIVYLVPPRGRFIYGC